MGSKVLVWVSILVVICCRFIEVFLCIFGFVCVWLLVVYVQVTCEHFFAPPLVILPMLLIGSGSGLGFVEKNKNYGQIGMD